MKSLVLFLFVVLPQIILICGCSESVGLLDGKDRSNVMVRDAAARKNSGNIDGALQLYAEALDRSPKLAVAHLDMAIIFHDFKKDYLRAVYHYERYLELRPGTEKRKMIEDRIRLAGQLFAAKIAEDGSAAAQIGKLSEGLTELKRENEALKNSVKELNLQLEQAKSGTADVNVPHAKPLVPIQDEAPARNGKTKTIAVKQPVVRTYLVKRGDSLRSIAAEMYRDAEKADDIFKANRDKLESPGQLKIGQTLVLP